MFSFLKPAPAATPLPPDRIDHEYRRQRWRVFAGIFVGYAGFYLVRNNLALAMPDILKEYPGRFTNAQLGTGLTAIIVAYGVSKFIMGSISDRSNPRTFLPLGLLLSAGIIAIFGFAKAIYASLAVIVVLSALNGWVNGMGWPPCGKTMVHWYSARERGRVVSFWNVAHNVGGILVAQIAILGMFLFHDWGSKFYLNAIVAACIAVFAWFFMRDTPQSCGLPPIEVYKNDYPPDYSEKHERTFTFKEIFIENILYNKYLWAIAVANAFVYFVRYGVVSWVPVYLETAKHLSIKESGIAWSLFEFAAIPGTILCGWVSDKIFRSRRAPTTMLFMALTLIGILLYWFNMHGPVWIDYVALFIAGFFIYGPVMLIGLHALELVPKKAAGTAAGFTGLFGNTIGGGAAGIGVGWISDHFQWNGVFATMTVCCVLTMVFSALTLKHRPVRNPENKGA